MSKKTSTALVAIKKPRITVLPKVTREMVLEENPDLAWTHADGGRLTGEVARSIRDREYEGRATG